VRADGDTYLKRGRAVLFVSNAMLVAAALIVTSPWTSGLYTWYVQRHLTAEVAPAPRQTVATTAAAEPTHAPTLAAWQLEDAREWRTSADGSVVGRLTVPKLGLDDAIVKGVSVADLRKGPGWVPETSAPGAGNCGIAGHRTTYLAPFRGIDRLGPGDVITLATRRGAYTFRVSRRFFVASDDSDILLPTVDPTLTLTSCHPPYSAQFRIVVQARLVAARRR
jgi:sortase A